MTSSRRRRQNLPDHDNGVDDYARDEEARADRRFAGWRRRNNKTGQG